MRYAVYAPNYGSLGSPRDLVAMGILAEESGWDGFFIYDTLIVDGLPVADPQIVLAAIASGTSELILGALVTPLARRRPWKVAREIASLSALSDGRVVLGIGLGMPTDFSAFSAEPQSPRARGAALRDNLDLLQLLLEGETVTWRQSTENMLALEQTERATVCAPGFLPSPMKHVPIWAAATLASNPAGLQTRRPFERARSLDGIFPIPDDAPRHLVLEEVERVVRLTFGESATRVPFGFDLVVEGEALGHQRPDLSALEKLGTTWWLETLPVGSSLDDARALIRSGPPK